MMYREIIAVCSQIHTKHINTLCGQNVELLNVKLVVHIVITGLYSGVFKGRMWGRSDWLYSPFLSLVFLTQSAPLVHRPSRPKGGAFLCTEPRRPAAIWVSLLEQMSVKRQEAQIGEDAPRRVCCTLLYPFRAHIHYICATIFNHLTPNGHYMGRTAQLTSRCCILYIYSTNIRTEYFKHAA